MTKKSSNPLEGLLDDVERRKRKFRDADDAYEIIMEKYSLEDEKYGS